MLFNSTLEFALVIAFLAGYFLVRALKLKIPVKAMLFVGNVVVLFSILSMVNVLFHVLLSAFVCGFGFWIHRLVNGRLKSGVSAALIGLLVLAFVYRNYAVETSLIGRLGISYLLFRHIQFIVDVRNGIIRNYRLIDYINFTLFFPNFLAGPIDTFSNFSKWHNKLLGKAQRSLILPGIARIAMGTVKKYALVPFIIAEATDYSLLVNLHGVYLGLLASLVAYSAYIYLDFSGYSDIAIGTGYLMGIRTPENFRSPYLSTNLADFWRRWHITFSTFLRNLIFKPIVTILSRWLSGFPRLAVSSAGYILTFVLCGMWHGNTWNFVLWGLWHGLGLVVLKLWGNWQSKLIPPSVLSAKGYQVCMIAITFGFVTLGWVFFNYSLVELREIWSML